jgi:hypothetical protein
MIKKWHSIGILISLIAYPASSLYSAQKKFYQCISVPGASDRASGRTSSRDPRSEAVNAYVVVVDAVSALVNPGLVLLAENLDAAGKAAVEVNGKHYDIPPAPGGLLGKIVIPLKPDHLRSGLNRVSFLKAAGAAYQVVDARIEDLAGRSARAVAVTYLPVSAASTIADFDFVTNPKSANKRKESELAQWAQRGKIRFYRAGVDAAHLDRMFEMFKEAHINIVMLQVPTPTDTQSAEYRSYKDFFDRCHAAGIKVMYDGGNGAQPVRLNSISLESVLLHPHMRQWISQDEYGIPRWRTPRRAFWPDLSNKEYRNEVLKVAEIAIDAGADAFYYDWAIGKTADLVGFFAELRDLTNRKKKNIPMYGNCKGNILVEKLCDFTKTEAIEEPGIWDGKWVNNVAQARFYYAAGDGWKPYESKYEGADPGAPHPGAHDVKEGMKCGWKRPMAEAAAFQSHWVIAEAGRSMFQGWVLKNNDLAMTAWNDICLYNGFLREHEALYTDVRAVSNIGLLAPPAIPSFELRLARSPLYNALGEMNFVYDVLLIPELSDADLTAYKALVVPDITWMDDKHLRLLERYRQAGGQILTVGSSDSVRKVSTATLPAATCQDIQKQPVREEFKRELLRLSGDPLVTIRNPGFVIANLVKKRGSGRVIAHFVNYSQPADDVNVRLNLAGVVSQIDPKSIRLLSPDNVSKQLKDLSVRGTEVAFTIPRIEIYGVVVIN